MPLITITLLKGRTSDEKMHIADSIHTALVTSGVPLTDRFQRILELEPENFIFDKTYPDLPEPRTEKFVLIEILFSVGRSVKVKRKILADLMNGLKTDGINPNDIMVVFKETAWENWAFANGEIIHI
jgi:phenylpyruvate tautomerase PptA (4-oxalocrotonate tautomerase family)